MTDVKSQSEPSMEEILASIRRIISEDADGSKPAPQAAGPAATPAAAMAAPRDDVLDLTNKVNDDGSVISLDRHRREPDPFDDKKDDLDFGAADFSDGLMSRAAADASANAFAALSDMNRDPDPEPMSQMSYGSGITVEQLVRETLKPVLKDWLDRNLPPIVEELVKAEIQRVAAGGGGGPPRRR